MQVHQDIHQLPEIKNPVVTIGTFDGVHAGHRTIIQRILDLAKLLNGESVLVTFEPHPRLLINPKFELKLLNTLAEKMRLLEKFGLHHLVIAPFTASFANLSAEQYIEDFLVNRLKPHTLVIGYDHHFGKNRSGNFELLKKYAEGGHFELEEISKQLVDDAHVSSTTIRHAIEAGHIVTANQLLLSYYSLSGIVITGDQKGRTIGFPTANLEVADAKKLIPANGVYAVRVFWQGKSYDGVMNIGHRPTVLTTNELRLEVHIFDFSASLYGEELRVHFIDKIREEIKFESIHALQAQIKKDCEQAKAILQQLGTID